MDLASVDEFVSGGREHIRAVKEGTFDGYMVPLSSLSVRAGFNEAREADPDYPQHVRELADSIKANGFMRHKAIVIAAASDGSLYIQDGHTRYAAVLLANSEGAGVENVPVIQEERGTTEEDRIFGLITNNSGKRLTPMGEALVIKRLLGRGIQEKEIARRLGFSAAKVSDALTLVAAPTPIREMVVAGEVSATTAVRAIKKDGIGAVKKLADAVAVAQSQGKTKASEKHMKPPKVSAALHADTARLEYMLDAYAAVRKCGAVGDKPECYVCEDSQGLQLGRGVSMRGAIDNAISKKAAA